MKVTTEIRPQWDGGGSLEEVNATLLHGGSLYSVCRGLAGN